MAWLQGPRPAPGRQTPCGRDRHSVHAGSAGFPRASLPDLEVQAREFLDVRDMLEEIYHRHTKRPKEQLRKDMERDYFMAPETAREYGLIDRVVEPRQTGRFGGSE